MGRGEGAQRFGQQVVERVQIRLHVTVRRVDHDRRALHDVIAGKQQALFEQQVAKVIGGVPRRVQHLQDTGLGGDQVAMPGLVVRPEPGVLGTAGGAGQPNRRQPVRAFSVAAAGEWSRWVWVTST